MIKAEWSWLADGGWVRNSYESEGPPKHINATANWALTRVFLLFIAATFFFFHVSVLCWCMDMAFFGGFGTARQMGVCQSESGMRFGAAHLSTNFRVGDHRVRACCCHSDGRLTAQCSLHCRPLPIISQTAAGSYHISVIPIMSAINLIVH